MEKSIENIWKEGFANSNMSIPRIDNIEKLKSIYIIDEFKRAYKKNVILLILTAVIILFAFIIGGTPFLGIFLFLLFFILAILGQRELNGLEELDLEENNYDYIVVFNHWLKGMLNKFSLVYKIWIPLFFIGFSLGILQTSLFIPFFGNTLMDKILADFTIYTIAGFPVFWMLGILCIAVVLSYFSNYFFKKDINSVYGGLLGKIKHLIMEMEELKK